MKKIIVKLVGGLGNQLFQFAAARGIASQLDREVFLDTEEFKTYTLHNYSLNHFNIGSKILELPSLPISGKIGARVNRLYKKIFISRRFSYIHEKNFKNFCNLDIEKKDIYLDGYWQSEKYFFAIRAELLKELRFKNKPANRNIQVLNDIHISNSVFIHIRRGDYVTNPDANKVHGTCSLEYYRDSVKLLKDRGVINPSYYIFSDDPKWAKENLQLENSTVVDWNGPDKNYEDIRLMSSCKHAIIANSSFSWWGAWLMEGKNSLIIAPKKWFNVPNQNERDIIPERWIKI